MKKVISGYYFLVMLISGLVLQSCSQDEELKTLASENQTILTISASARDYVTNNVDDRTRASEADYLTSFEKGDAIGIYVVQSDGNIVGEDCANLKFTLTESEGWRGEGNMPLYYYDGSVYIAYYPYDEALSLNLEGIDSPETFEKAIVSAFTVKLGATGDQSSEYFELDVMTAKASVTDPQMGDNIDFDFSHQLAMVEIKLPAVYYRNGEGLEPYYTIPIAKEPEFQKDAVGIVPYNMGNGTYRFLVVPDEEFSVGGSFISFENGKNVTYKKENLSLAAGCYYRMNVKYGNPGDYIQPLQTGDFFMKDGSLIAKGTELTDEQKENCIGVVFYTADPTDEGLGDPALRNEYPQCVHGLVVAMKIAGGSTWSNNTTVKIADSFGEGEGKIPVADYYNSSYLAAGVNDGSIRGYHNTNLLKLYNETAVDSDDVLAVQTVLGYADANNAFAPKVCTGWYLPSVGELVLLLEDTDNSVSQSLQAVGGDAFGTDFYWSSTEASALNACRVQRKADNTLAKNAARKTFTPKIRAILAF